MKRERRFDKVLRRIDFVKEIRRHGFDFESYLQAVKLNDAVNMTTEALLGKPKRLFLPDDSYPRFFEVALYSSFLMPSFVEYELQFGRR
jgi:hypothetical protein